MTEAVHLLISGRVQGVWYRASARDQARRQGLTGWVRNRPDGRVEALAEGPRAELEAFITWCHQGPPAARVDDIEIDWREAGGTFKEFGVG